MEPDRKTPKLAKLNRRAFGSAAAVLCACRVCGRRFAGSSRKPRRQRLRIPISDGERRLDL